MSEFYFFFSLFVTGFCTSLFDIWLHVGTYLHKQINVYAWSGDFFGEKTAAF